MRVNASAIEQFYEGWEFQAELMLSGSDCESQTISTLLRLEPDAGDRPLGLRLGYTEVNAERSSVLLLPGSVYEQPEHLRIGFGRADLPTALERLDACLKNAPIAV